MKATYYHDKFENRKTSSGEVFSQKLYTAAHRTLPLHTVVKVMNKRTGKSVLVKINDRCARKVIIDLSKSAAGKIALRGTEQVIVEVLGKDYRDILAEQVYLFNEELAGQDSITQYIDSLIEDKKNNMQYSYYVVLATVENERAVENITDNLPEQYRHQLIKDKIYNENFYQIKLGPFVSSIRANAVVQKLKNDYPLVHLIKIRDD